ncbi:MULTISPECIES: helix-turn-helix transcriptional regulator [unclassified Cryobacterium]|uniref:helix-turn-helix domain-containing protein n=1 Tax=unclassified Cryobacterium TaxID=2649013 RepID=UPI00106A7DEC|nr:MULTISPECIES: helix-turn-helix transcriptional regulator [unclassified Cryobacterium]TFB98559.1 XRE family transcriptional regulator [Cryobacterium sp. MDB2-A-1]TFC08442.1 XRE family transcriptional regulator [Cryobacterium sp. MDB2-33-2]TFC08708.1 XRE family transcriptional regulator [Cryobacterium sp. MDB2-A-2]TFC22236.1 XRE family transcriptional regulator [Cryobacterium sp. MDB2-10]
MVSSKDLPTTDGDADSGATAHRIRCHLDDVLAERGMTLTELSARTGITIANLSILKNNRAKAVRFTSLTLICDALQTQPAELFTMDAD